MIKLLFIGDIVGKPGRAFVINTIPKLRKDLNIDLIVANAENAAGGSGLNASIAIDLLKAGIDGITLGDHVWDQRGFEVDINNLPHVCRPVNLPKACPGKHYLILEKEGFKLAVFIVLGRTFMKIKADCPFRSATALLDEIKGQADAIFSEIHAETTSEKVAFGRYMEGKVALVAGTHTHIPTADATVLKGGTAYITDVGMSGPYDSSLGIDVDTVIQVFFDGMPRRFSVAKNDVRLCGCLTTIDPSTGLATAIEPICIKQDEL